MSMATPSGCLSSGGVPFDGVPPATSSIRPSVMRYSTPIFRSRSKVVTKRSRPFADGAHLRIGQRRSVEEARPPLFGVNRAPPEGNTIDGPDVLDFPADVPAPGPRQVQESRLVEGQRGHRGHAAHALGGAGIESLTRHVDAGREPGRQHQLGGGRARPDQHQDEHQRDPRAHRGPPRPRVSIPGISRAEPARRAPVAPKRAVTPVPSVGISCNVRSHGRGGRCPRRSRVRPVERTPR